MPAEPVPQLRSTMASFSTLILQTLRGTLRMALTPTTNRTRAGTLDGPRWWDRIPRTHLVYMTCMGTSTSGVGTGQTTRSTRLSSPRLRLIQSVRCQEPSGLRKEEDLTARHNLLVLHFEGTLIPVILRDRLDFESRERPDSRCPI